MHSNSREHAYDKPLDLGFNVFKLWDFLSFVYFMPNHTVLHVHYVGWEQIFAPSPLLSPYNASADV